MHGNADVKESQTTDILKKRMVGHIVSALANEPSDYRDNHLPIFKYLLPGRRSKLKK